MKQFEKPILFIVFKRLDTTKRVFEQIKKLKPLKLYIASDGPRNESEKAKVLQVREFILKNIDWDCKVKTKFRDKNLGVGFGPNDAIDWFFSHEEEGIILEDDCLPSISFFYFCQELLDMYRDNKKIGVIQGFSPFSQKDYPYSYFFSIYDLKWGGGQHGKTDGNIKICILQIGLKLRNLISWMKSLGVIGLLNFIGKRFLIKSIGIHIWHGIHSSHIKC